MQPSKKVLIVTASIIDSDNLLSKLKVSARRIYIDDYLPDPLSKRLTPFLSGVPGRRLHEEWLHAQPRNQGAHLFICWAC